LVIAKLHGLLVIHKDYRQVMDLVGVAEIAELLGVTTQRVDQLARTDEFPAPVAVISAGRIWKRTDVEKWARARGRLS
jgi:prophage regulatory protein